MKNMGKKALAMFLSLCLMFTLIVPSFAAGTFNGLNIGDISGTLSSLGELTSLLGQSTGSQTSTDKLSYGPGSKLVFLGDSIDLGYNMVDYFPDDYGEMSESTEYMMQVMFGGDGAMFAAMMGPAFLNHMGGAYDYANNLHGGRYSWAYPFQFGEMVGVDKAHVYDYGIGGAMAGDVANMLKGTLAGDNGNTNYLNATFNAIIRDPKMEGYLKDMRSNVATGDLVGVHVGGNNIYQNFMMGYQMAEDAGQIGQLLGLVSMLMGFHLDIRSMLGFFQMLIPSEGASPLGAEAETMSLSANDILKLVDYYAPESIYDYFVTSGVINEILAGNNDILSYTVTAQKNAGKNGQLAVISQYNPFGAENYLNYLKQQWENKEFLKSLGENSLTLLRILKDVLEDLQVSAADLSMIGNKDWAQKIADGLNKAFAAIGKMKLEDWESQEVYSLLASLMYPMLTLIAGEGLRQVYQEVNSGLQTLARKYGALYIDISDAPANGRFDPHPKAEGHTWIAQRIYDTLLEEQEFVDSLPTELFNKFTIFGDSAALGLSNGIVGSGDVMCEIVPNAVGNVFPNCYPTQVAQMLGLDTTGIAIPDRDANGVAIISDDNTAAFNKAQLYNFGVCGMMSTDLVKFLTDEHQYMSGFVKMPESPAYKYYMRLAAQQSDLLAVSTGNNDIYESFMLFAAAGDGETPLVKLVGLVVLGLEFGIDMQELVGLITMVMESLTPKQQVQLLSVAEEALDTVEELSEKEKQELSKEIIALVEEAEESPESLEETTETGEADIKTEGSLVDNLKKDLTDTAKQIGDDVKKTIDEVKGNLWQEASEGYEQLSSLLTLTVSEAAGLESLKEAVSVSQEKAEQADEQAAEEIGEEIGEMSQEVSEETEITTGSEAEAEVETEETLEPMEEEKQAEKEQDGGLADLGESLPENVLGLLYKLIEALNLEELAKLFGNLELSTLLTADSFKKLLEYYSVENINEYFKTVLKDYDAGVRAAIKELQSIKGSAENHKDYELILIGHFNPYSLQKYLYTAATELMNGDALRKIVYEGKGVYSLLKAIYGTPEQVQSMMALSDAELAAAQDNTAATLEKIVAALESGATNDQLTQLVNEMTYPMTVMMIGSAMDKLMDDMIAVDEQIAADMDIHYVDINGIVGTTSYFDPHPNAEGHTWIAEQIFDAVAPAITASVSPLGLGHGRITGQGIHRLRVCSDATYYIDPDAGSKIGAIYIDGVYQSQMLNPELYKNGIVKFDKVDKGHTITVRFDIDLTYRNPYTPTNPGSGVHNVSVKSAQTADMTNMTGMLIVVSLSVAGLMGLAFYGKKKELF